MDEQTLRDEIDAARASRFPSQSTEQLKALLRDIYYKSINEEKILAVNGPESKKEAHIQNILTAASAAALVEEQIINVEPEWVSPTDSIVSLDGDSLFWSALSSAPTIIGGTGSFAESLTVSGVPVRIDSGSVSEAFPVGSVFLSVVSTDPASMLGYGTWTAIATGQMLVGFDAGDVDFNAAEKVGGAKTATLATANLPIHNHPVVDPGHNHIQNPHNHPISGGSSDDTSAPFTGPDASTSTSTTFTGGVGNSTATNNSNTTGISVGNTGSGAAFSVMNPFFCVYIWKRVS
jgi:microcystin-dependent protein